MGAMSPLQDQAVFSFFTEDAKNGADIKSSIPEIILKITEASQNSQYVLFHRVLDATLKTAIFFWHILMSLVARR